MAIVNIVDEGSLAAYSVSMNLVKRFSLFARLHFDSGVIGVGEFRQSVEIL